MKLEPLMTLHVDLKPPVEIGNGPTGHALFLMSPEELLKDSASTEKLFPVVPIGYWLMQTASATWTSGSPLKLGTKLLYTFSISVSL